MLVLAEFDVRLGNRIIWQSEAGNIDGVEFKMLPSGSHNRLEDTIYFQHAGRMGCAVYTLRGNTRETARFYALAALMPQLEWSQETFLRDALEKYMAVGDTDVLPRQLGAPDPRCHPVLAADRFLACFGAQVFELWKAGLSRTRLLLFVSSSVHDGSQFDYILSRITAIPSDVRHLLPEHRQASRYTDPESIYNVTLHDLAELQQMESFVACTTDEMLTMPRQDACDIVARPKRITALAADQKITVTWTDSHRFSIMAKAFGVSAEPSGIVAKLASASSNALMWWATAGESASIDAQEAMPLLETGPDGVALIGQFHNYTRNLVRCFHRLAEEYDGAIRITATDLAALGLDIFSRQDREFLQRFSLVWWDRPVYFAGYCGCC